MTVLTETTHPGGFLVWEAFRDYTREVVTIARIADDLMEAAFPLTCSQAREKGALRMLRTGIVSEVKRILRNRYDGSGQADFSEFCAGFAPLVKDLRSKSYFVESAEEYVAIPDLIAEPALLDDARRFMRRKGIECLAEADRLDALYAAVTSNDPAASRKPQEVSA